MSSLPSYNRQVIDSFMEKLNHSAVLAGPPAEPWPQANLDSFPSPTCPHTPFNLKATPSD